MQIIEWHRVCACEDIDEEDVREFQHEGNLYAVYHTPTGFYATAGVCTHETARLADGFVFGDVIECPMHMGRFDIPSGKAQGAPVCVNLTVHPVKTDNGAVFIGLEGRRSHER
ncbi:non-heme iron oxygenase ferredoxin subunit [Paraburkholderia diazotrophica]|uniref:Rieske [2Fe-2S] domain protein, MocE subfamily n=1 Tax=Paraburkholderia diazotrophica TaxID=667676 RepID=A0A1H7C690_9BURK|nr:non-heme iron oxygenase ferredoxin subunit [Paraburkholderia diazotrophica]SEJ85211.1 Rieske [2Fe-2S] domain protein, MocE subfamily [Paraburkholderia diazotrophica]